MGSVEAQPGRAPSHAAPMESAPIAHVDALLTPEADHHARLCLEQLAGQFAVLAVVVGAVCGVEGADMDPCRLVKHATSVQGESPVMRTSRSLGGYEQRGGHASLHGLDSVAVISAAASLVVASLAVGSAAMGKRESGRQHQCQADEFLDHEVPLFVQQKQIRRDRFMVRPTP